MRLLLDTHVLLWWLADDPTISAPAREAIASPANLVLYSAASIWEIRVKQALGKVELTADFRRTLERQPLHPLDVRVAHAHAVADLPAHHRDPFDRLLVAQARVEDLTIVTRDPALAAYGVPVLSA